jgi:membrane protein
LPCRSRWSSSTFSNYASYYAGLAGIIAALYFMYLAALVMIFGGELNRAIRIRRLARALSEGDGG